MSAATAPPQTAVQGTGPDGRGVLDAELAALVRRERRTTVLIWITRVLVVVVPVVLWQVLAERGVLPQFIFSRPTAVAERLGEWLADGTIARNLLYTLRNALLGYVLGLLVGAGLAVALTRWRKAGDVLMPFITAINSIPRIAFAPLLVAWFGFGLLANLSLVVLVVMFVNFFAVYSGLQSVEEDHIWWSRGLGATERQVWRAVRLPAIIRWVLSALRISTGLALSAAIVSEFVGGARGMGYLVSSSTNVFQSSGVYAGMVVVILVVGVIDTVLRRVEKRFAHWVGT